MLKEDLEDTLNESISDHLTKKGVTEDNFRDEVGSILGKYISENEDELKDQYIEFVKEQVSYENSVQLNVPDDGEPELAHKQLDQLTKTIAAGLPTLMVGLPGTGKTYGAKQAAERLDIDFHSISVGTQTTKTDILGFVDANGNYKGTGFREAFENGGLFLMDEIDAGNPNVLIIINSAISNGFCEFPDGMVEGHDDFRFVATANTYGKGANKDFIGRNKLDGATLDRFVAIDWEIDEDLEEVLTDNDAWLEKIRALREHSRETTWDFFVSPRSAIYGAKLLKAGFDMEEAAEMVLMKESDEDRKKKIKDVMNI